MTEKQPPVWPSDAVFPPRGLTPEEAALVADPQWAPLGGDRYPTACLRWRAPELPVRAMLVVLHGVQSHAGWYQGLGRRLAAAGYAAWFPDRRGSGANTRERGHAASARQLLDDVADLARRLRSEHPGRPLVLAGISWGGKLVVSLAARNPELIDAFALIGPGLTPRVNVSRRERLAVAAALLTGRSARATFPLPLADPALFTADPAAQRFIAGDPLSLRRGTAGLLASSFFLDRRVRRAPARVRQPALLMLAGQDRIVDNPRTLATFRRLASRDTRVIDYPDAHHTLEFEPDPARYARDLIAWLDEVVAPGETAR